VQALAPPRLVHSEEQRTERSAALHALRAYRRARPRGRRA
jgi:hypothetical protein